MYSIFGKEGNENVENFMSFLDDFEEDRKKRIEAMKKFGMLDENSSSHEETTKWKVEGKDEI